MPHIFNFEGAFKAVNNRFHAIAMSKDTLAACNHEHLRSAMEDMNGGAMPSEFLVLYRELPLGLVALLSKGNNVLAARIVPGTGQ